MTKPDIKVSNNLVKFNTPQVSFKGEGAKTYVENYKNNLTSDKVEISNKKEAPKKKSFWKSTLGIATMAASATLATIGGIRLHKNIVFERQIKKIYNEISADIVQQMEKQSFKFEKPKLKFINKLIGKRHKEMGSCSYIDNVISLNKDKLMGDIYIIKYKENSFLYAYGKKDLKTQLLNNKGSELIGKLSKEEKEIHLTEILAHEARHSIQNQIMLTQDKDAVLKVLSGEKPIEKLKGTWIYNYTPQEQKKTIVLTSELPSSKKLMIGDNKEINKVGYTAKDFIKGNSRFFNGEKAKNSDEEIIKYLSNPTEIEARIYSGAYVEKKYGKISELPENIKHRMKSIYNEVYLGINKAEIAPIAVKDNKVLFDKAGNEVRFRLSNQIN